MKAARRYSINMIQKDKVLEFQSEHLRRIQKNDYDSSGRAVRKVLMKTKFESGTIQ